MRDTLAWTTPGESFEDGSKLADWVRIEESGVWHLHRVIKAGKADPKYGAPYGPKRTA
ncbi:MAG: hypothetical protein MI920_19695 [Kiloniellales bacterium]|nr:hypothetical protein [Kiloniellales bacterium]